MGDTAADSVTLPRGEKSDSETVPPGTSTTPLLVNLLPLTNASQTLTTKGVYVGDGLPPVPSKLALKIRRGDYVDMGELLPEFWSPQKDDNDVARPEVKARRSRKVTDIFTWLQCFGTYVSVRTTHQPELIPELMAYMSMIIRASQDYTGLAWVRYDAAYRRQAALTGTTRWSAINSTLYTMCFTGMAKAVQRCELCFATSHTERECAQQGDSDPGLPERFKAIENAVLALTSTSPLSQKPGIEPCRLWNRNRCTYPKCRHLHQCSNCGGKHPLVSCPTAQSTSTSLTQGGSASTSSKHFFGSARPY